jgi:EpsI family protein
VAVSTDQGSPARAGGRAITTLVLVLLMVGAAALAYHFTPRKFLADQGQKLVLETMLPARFGAWQVDPSITPVVADPSQNELIERIYSETLSRTYINTQGKRIMLTVAYGRDQSESMQVHTPEVCYPAQGFTVTSSVHQSVPIGFKNQPVVRLQAAVAERREPITYWITMGEYVVNGGARDRRNVRFRYGFDGFVPDGMLFRISSIGPDADVEYEQQRLFLQDLFASMPPATRDRFAGTKSY